MNRKADLVLLAFSCLLVFSLSFLLYSKYWIKTDLDVLIINQTSACYSYQTPSSLAGWSGGGIVLITGFSVPDPCYRAGSIQAIQQADRIEVNITTAPGGICAQCFGFRTVEYEILSPQKEGVTEIVVYIDGIREETLSLRIA